MSGPAAAPAAEAEAEEQTPSSGSGSGGSAATPKPKPREPTPLVDPALTLSPSALPLLPGAEGGDGTVPTLLTPDAAAAGAAGGNGEPRRPSYFRRPVGSPTSNRVDLSASASPSFDGAKSGSRAGGGPPGRWLEANREVDAASLVQSHLEVSGLTEAIREIVRGVLQNTRGLDRSRAESEKLFRILEDQRRESGLLERRCKDLEEELYLLRKEMKLVHQNNEILQGMQEFREVHEIKVVDLQQECRRIDACKVDSSSPQLETDARRYALDTVKSFFATRNKEVKTWVEKKLQTLRTSMTQDLSESSDGLGREISDVAASLEQALDELRNDAGAQLETHASMLSDCQQKFTAHREKLVATEAAADVTEGAVRRELERARKETRLLYLLFCTTYAELSKRVGAGWDRYTSPDDRAAARDTARASLQVHEMRAQTWRQVHKPMEAYGPVQPVQQLAFDTLEADLQKATAKLREAAEPPESPAEEEQKEEALRRGIAQGENVSTEAVEAVVSSKVFTALRATTDQLVQTLLQQSVEDIREDLSKETQVLGKELKTKVTAAKCVDIIGRQVGEDFAREKQRTDMRFSQLEESKVSVQRVYELLREKSDVTAMDLKADRAAMLQMFEYINNKVGVESSDDVVKKAIRNLNTKVEQLEARKLDSNQPEMTVLFDMLRAGGLTSLSGPAAAASPGTFSPAPASVAAASAAASPSPSPALLSGASSLMAAAQPATVAGTTSRLPGNASRGPVSGGVAASLVKHAPSPPPPAAASAGGRAGVGATGKGGKGGSGSGAGNSNAGGNAACMSCQRAPPDAVTLDDVLKQRERDRQEQQALLHHRQVYNATSAKIAAMKREQRQDSPPVDVGAYITNLASSAETRPRPPSSQVVTAADPRHVPK